MDDPNSHFLVLYKYVDSDDPFRLNQSQLYRLKHVYYNTKYCTNQMMSSQNCDCQIVIQAIKIFPALCQQCSIVFLVLAW